MSARFSIVHLAKNATLPKRAILMRIKNAAVGKAFSVSLVFAGPARMRALNRTYRNKSYAPSVLAFRLAKNEGEMFIGPSVAAREARAAGVSASTHIAYLFIHGLLHLKGHAHGATMTQSEKRLCKIFKVPQPAHLHRGAKNLLRN